jgi:sugar phosphate permease
MERTIEQRAMRKVYWRILPFTGLLYFICYLDRVNVGFAALTMRGDLGLSQAQFGLGAGTAFFLGYFILEVPEWDVPLRPAQGRSYSCSRRQLVWARRSMRSLLFSLGNPSRLIPVFLLIFLCSLTPIMWTYPVSFAIADQNWPYIFMGAAVISIAASRGYSRYRNVDRY